MQYLKYFLVFTVIFTACKTKKNMIDGNLIAKETSAKKVAKKHVSANFTEKTVEAKLKANFDNGKTSQSVSVTMKIIKDEVIWLKGTKFISVFKAKITPAKVQFYSPLVKNYFDGDFSMLTKLLGVDINFVQLQNLFLGQALQNLKEEKQELTIVENEYVLSPEKQAKLFDIFFNINPTHFKLNKQTIVNIEKNQRLEVFYPDYQVINNVVFPKEINIRAKQATKFTNIDFMFKTVTFNTDLDVSFSVPNGYKRIQL